MSLEHDPTQETPEESEGYVPQVHLEPEQPVDPESGVPDSEANHAPLPEQAPLEHTEEPEPTESASEAPAESDEPEETDHPEEIDESEALASPPPFPPTTDEPEETTDEEPPKPRKKKNKLFIALTSLFVVLALSLVGGISYVYFVIKPYESYDKIMPNVYCAGINLGGMTKDEAKEAIEEALSSPSNSVKVILPDGTYTFNPQQEGVTLNAGAVVDRAYRYLRSDTTAYGMYRAYRSAKSTEYRLTAETELVYSQEDIEKKAKEISDETYIAATDTTADYDEETHTVTLTLGTPGRIVEADTITKAVDNAFASLDFSDITLDYDKVEIDTGAVRRLANQCAQDYGSEPVEPQVTADSENHTIEVTMGTPGYTLDPGALYDAAKQQVESGDYGTVSQEMTEVLPTDVDITDAYHELACDPTEPYYAGGDVQEGYDGYTLDWDAAVADIMNTGWGDTVSIAMTAVPPEKTADEIRAVLFRDQLSTFSSPHTANSGRTANLKLACSAINGTVINSGETFSFNGVVGERTAAKGYQKATVYVGSDSVEETGGGICQVASTVYDAALYADLEITERAPHTFFVTYVNGGLDATVYWGSQDFCFRNNTDYPIRVDAWVSGGYVNISIYGTKTNDNYVVLDYSKLSTTPYSTVTEYDGSLPSGTTKEKTYPYTGYTYEAYQYVYSGDGTLLETNYLGKSVYKKRDRVIVVGTG